MFRICCQASRPTCSCMTGECLFLYVVCYMLIKRTKGTVVMVTYTGTVGDCLNYPKTASGYAKLIVT